MRLSQMNSDQLSNAICALVEPVKNLCSDPEFDAAFTSFRAAYAEGGSLVKHFGLMFTKMAPLLLGSHRQDVYAIVSAMTGKSAEAIAEQNGLQTIRDLVQCVDKDLIDFFKSPGAANREK